MDYSYKIIGPDGTCIAWYTRELKEAAYERAAQIGATVQPMPPHIFWNGNCLGYPIPVQASLNQFSINPAARFFRSAAKRKDAA